MRPTHLKTKEWLSIPSDEPGPDVETDALEIAAAGQSEDAAGGGM